jgi:hypothetical protein
MIVLALTSNPTGKPPTLPTSVPQELPATNNDFSFFENFEDGSADGFKNKLGLWVVVSEVDGNKVLDVNSMGSSTEYPTIEFGELSWKDFIFESRVNLVDYSPSNDAPLTSLIFRGNYSIAFTPYWSGFDLVYKPGWDIIAGRTTAIQRNTWYSVRIEANGSQINIFLDDKLTIAETVSHESSGSFGFGTWPEVHIQFDDISIKPISK